MKRMLTLATLIAAVAGLTGTSVMPANAATRGGNPQPVVIHGTLIKTLHGGALKIVRFKIPSPSTTGAVPEAGSIYSHFDFWNDSIAHFVADMEFLSRYEFEIYDVKLSDTKCDSRSVLAAVLDQQNIYVVGYYGGLPYTYKYSGCNSTGSMPTYFFEGSSPGVKYVYIALWAGNSTSHSSFAYSLKHYNLLY